MKNKLLILLCMAGLLYAKAEQQIEIPMDNIEVIQDKELKKGIDTKDSIKKLEALVEEKKIESENSNIVKLNEVNSSFGSSDSVININEIAGDISKKVNTFKMKKYKNIKYIKGYDWFSIYPPNESTYEKYLSRINLNRISAKALIGRIDSPQAIYASAIYYDLIKKQPELAENFYLKYPEIFKKYRFFAKEILVDYLIRTGRFQKNNDFLSRGNCFSLNFRYQKECFYYNGVSEFLTTGNNKNIGLRFAKDRYPKAKKIYNK